MKAKRERKREFNNGLNIRAASASVVAAAESFDRR